MTETPETPTERAERVERMYAKCARRGGGSMADVATLRNDVRAFAAALKRAETERDDAQSDYAVVGSNLNAAYRERAHLVALLAAQYPAEFREDPEDDEWSIVYIDLPTGQASWHIHPRDVDLFPHVKFGTAAEWDGHSTEEKYRRIDELARQLAKAGGR
jgi:hypothetical protein